MRSYPETPPGWTELRRRRIGPFTTHVTYRRGDGGTAEWRSRAHRKHASLLSRGGHSGWWAPRHASWWIAVLFISGSACFVVGPFPGFVQLVGAGADAVVLFNASTYDALRSGLSTPQENRLIRAPDVSGAPAS